MVSFLGILYASRSFELLPASLSLDHGCSSRKKIKPRCKPTLCAVVFDR